MTTIQISSKLQEKLNEVKLYNSQTYEEVLWDLIEDTSELSEQTKKEIKEAEKEIKEGKTYTHEEVKKELGL